MRLFNLKYSLFLSILFCTLSINAQDESYQKQTANVEAFFAAYNAQNYRAMKKTWGFLGKLIVSKNRMRKEFKPTFEKYGKATIDTIVFNSIYGCEVKLSMEKDPTKRHFMSFIFNDKAKFQGLGSGYPMLIYKEVRPIKTLDPIPFGDSITALIEKNYRKGSKPFNGVVAVLEKGEIVYHKEYGVAKMDSSEMINDSTVFELASVSKQFTAYAILMLVEEGKLSLEDSLRKFFPELPYSGITIHHLLTHSSGLPSYEDRLGKYWDHSKIAGNKDVIAMLAEHKPAVLFQPGERYSYCNTAFVLLASIIEESTQTTFQRAMDSMIFEPLGMQNTRVYNTRRTGELLNNYAFGYVYDSKTKSYILPDSSKDHRYVVYLDRISGDGTVNSNIHDLAIWEKELLHPTLLKPETQSLAFKNHTLNDGKKGNYGYGFFIMEGNGIERVLYHTGGWPGYHLMYLRLPDMERSILILNNTEYGRFSFLTDEIAVRITERSVD